MAFPAFGLKLQRKIDGSSRPLSQKRGTFPVSFPVRKRARFFRTKAKTPQTRCPARISRRIRRKNMPAQNSAAVQERGGRMVGKSVGFERTRRITGYLVGTLERFNNAKRAEEKDRVKHGA